jgi:phosphoribosylformylglycinamidine cyclo-ligase
MTVGKTHDPEWAQRCSAAASAWARRTFANRAGRQGAVVGPIEATASCLVEVGAGRVAMYSDGIGTKVEVAERLGRYGSLGFDLVAMVADELASNGLEPVNLSSVLEADRAVPECVEELMRGLHDAAAYAGLAVVGGEIAEIGNRVAGFGAGMHFNWWATGLGVLAPGREPVDGRRVTAGDSVVALKSRGFRANGFSALRRILKHAFGPEWHAVPFDAGATWGETLLTPSLIYTPLLNRVQAARLPVHGMAHVTAGGIPDAMRRVLRATGLGASLENLHDPVPCMKTVQGLGHLGEPQAYELWNMGNGLLMVLPERHVDAVIRMADEMGYFAREAGRVQQEPVLALLSLGNEPSALRWPLRPP